MGAGRVNASDRKIVPGMAGRHLADQPLPERERLGVGVVDAEGAHAVLAPEQRHLEQRVPQPAPVARPRSRAGRCPGSAWAGSRRTGWCRRAGAGTTRGARATQGWSGEHWKARSSATSISRSRAAATSASKSASVPSSGWIAVWPPSLEPMAHGLPGSPRPACVDVVRALAERRADGMDGRQVHHVEAGSARSSSRAADVGQRAGARPLCRPNGGTARTRSRTGTGPRRPRPALPATSAAPAPGNRAAGSPWWSIGLVDAGVDLPGQLVTPGGPLVDPGPDPEVVSTHDLGHERRLPPIETGVGRLHRDLDPSRRARRPVRHDHPEPVVAVREHAGTDDDRLADDPLDRMPTAVDDGGDLVDHDPTRRRGRTAHPVVLLRDQATPTRVLGDLPCVVGSAA